MPQASRQRLARLLAQHQVPLVEDVIWNDLTDAPELRHSVHSHDREGWVLLCGSYTKTLLPGVRLGWLYGPRWTEQLQRMKGNTSGGQTVALELTLAEVLQQKGMELHMRRLRSTFAQRMDDALALVGAGFPEDTRVTNPGAGMLLWIELPPAIDAMQLLQAALKEHICFSPGSLFSPTHRYCNYLRLGLGGPWNAAQRDAISRIGALARQML
jgi:DNA-binding transcriptional MocR family regulator